MGMFDVAARLWGMTVLRRVLLGIVIFVAVDGLAITSGHGDMMGPVVMVLVGIPMYFLPTIIATTRKNFNDGAVVVVNVFLGWTCLGWIVALAMAAGGRTKPSSPTVGVRATTKVCPDCAETVLADAKICRYCRHNFP